MATQYFGATLAAQGANDVTQDTSTTSRAVELVVNDAATGINKQRVLEALEAIRNKVIQSWPSVGL